MPINDSYIQMKRTSLKSCSFYERVCGDLLVGCSALATPIQDNISNGCYSRETKEAEHKARSEDDLPNNSNIRQSLSYDSIKAPPIKPSKDDGFISRSNKMLYSIEVPNGSTNDKVSHLFPEKTLQVVSIYIVLPVQPGLVPVVTSNNSSVTVALSHSSIGRQESIQYKLFNPSSSQELHKLLLGSIRSWNRPQVGANEGFRQNIQAFINIWSESELDSLWVGVRRHGKNNWYAMLRDPKLCFSPCRTEMDLAKQWIIEQTKLLGSTPSPSCPYAKPVGIRMPPSFVPPGPGSMTRFLTEPPQISLSNGYLNSQEVLPPRPPQNVTSGLGKGTRLLNQHVRAHRRSQNTENTWGRFKARDQVIPPQFPTPRASTSRNDILPSSVRGTFDNPHPQPPQPIPTLSFQHAGNSSEFHDEPNSKGIHIFKRNGISDLDCPGLALPSTQPGPSNPTDPKRPKEIIDLDSDASFEGTISGDHEPTLICKYK